MCFRLLRQRGGSLESDELGEFSSLVFDEVKSDGSFSLAILSSRDAISVLSAPRVDYLGMSSSFFLNLLLVLLLIQSLHLFFSLSSTAESLARRKAREEKVASQDLFRVPLVANEGSYQVAARSPDKTVRFPTTSDRSSSNPPIPRSVSNGNGQIPPPPISSHQSALPHHMQSPSQPNPLAFGSPQNSAPSPYQPNFSPSSTGDPLSGPTPPDFYQVGGGSFLGVFPDFFAAETDPAMVNSSS